MISNKNKIATPLVAKASEFHRRILQAFYPYPFTISVKNGQVSVKVDKIFKLKYVTFLIAVLIITGVFCLGSCLFVPFFKLFHRNDNISVIKIIFSVFLSSCAILELGTYFAYCRATEVEKLANQIFFIEQVYYGTENKKSKDWIGLFLLILNPVYIAIITMFPTIGIILHLDPFHHIFELILPTRPERNFEIIVVVSLARYFLGFIGILEFVRFISTLIFLCIIIIFTIVTCLRQLVDQSNDFDSRSMKLYIQLRIILKTADYFIRHVLMQLMITAQVLIVTMWWTVLKCWAQLPVYFTLVCFVVTSFTTATVMILLPRGVEICDTSKKFIEHKIAKNHTFSKHNKHRYRFLWWRAQRMLPIRFGVQFALNRDTPINYFDVLITNLTNSILLINP